MKTAVIIQARVGSSRLPGKVLLPLPTGRSVIDEVVYRASQIEGIDEVILAIPAQDVEILAALHMPCQVFFGPEHDVLARYAEAARKFRVDHIMRITADCPMLDPLVCEQVLRRYRETPTLVAPYVSNVFPKRTFPKGFDCEVFAYRVLDSANKKASNSYDREHVTPWMQRIIKTECVENERDESDESWTLDTIEDYRRIWRKLCPVNAVKCLLGRGSSADPL